MIDRWKLEMLVVDAAADAYFGERGVEVSTSMAESAVQRIVCPSADTYTGPSPAPSVALSATNGKRNLYLALATVL